MALSFVANSVSRLKKMNDFSEANFYFLASNILLFPNPRFRVGLYQGCAVWL